MSTAVITRTEELLDEIATYADRLADSNQLADTGSMATAEALAELYEKREWVSEWLEQKPIKEKKSYVGGRPAEPDSRNRFTQWLVWKEGQRNRRSLRSTQTYDLLTTYEIDQVISGSGNNPSAHARRPLFWLRKYRHVDHIPEVWQRAVKLAGSADRITYDHTMQAREEWKKEVLGAAGVQTAAKTIRAETHRLKAQAAVETLWADGDMREDEAFRQWFLNFLQEKAKAAA